MCTPMRGFLGTAIVVLVAGCTADTGPTTPALTGSLDHLNNSPQFNQLTLCKHGSAATFDVNGSTVELQDGECAVVATGQGLDVTVTELAAEAGYRFESTLTESKIGGNNPTSTPGSDPTVTLRIGDDQGHTLTYINVPIPVQPLPGRMTGGGSAFDAAGVRITHGFELHCDVADVPNNLEVNWNGNRFHMTELTSAVCTDDPAFDEGNPRAGFDTYTGEGVGRFNGVDGFNVSFVFIDDGEPGTGDIATISITDGVGTPVMSVSNFLDRGNHQAHP